MNFSILFDSLNGIKTELHELIKHYTSYQKGKTINKLNKKAKLNFHYNLKGNNFYHKISKNEKSFSYKDNVLNFRMENILSKRRNYISKLHKK